MDFQRENIIPEYIKLYFEESQLSNNLLHWDAVECHSEMSDNVISIALERRTFQTDFWL